MRREMVPHDGNSAVAHVAHATNEVIAIYPITPSSPMGEIADAKSAKGEVNIWGTVPKVVELQSEAGAAGAVHGSLTSGALTTTFTASQGLLLMIPNMYKISGELLPAVFHIAARSLACQALSIFGDHSDVMGVRSCGWAMLASGSVQESMDLALISHAATLRSRIPFLHFFEGFRVSHEIQKIEELTFDDIKEMIDNELVKQHRSRGMSPDNPVLRGTSQNPDVYFIGRETVNKYYAVCPKIVQEEMDKFAKLTGRKYQLFDYVGSPDAEDIIVVIGSGGEVVHETVEYLNRKGSKLGVVKVRLYRPFDVQAFANVLPKKVKRIAVLDRTKEPGSLGEPLYEDVRTAIGEAMHEKWLKSKDYPVVIGGRYGLGSAEFTPAMVKAVFENLKNKKPKNHFTVGVIDDVMNTSLEVDYNFSVEPASVYRAMFYGLGSDGTVSANKNSIKIIAEKTENYTQGYFEYDSKKAGAVTVSHLRFGKNIIRSPYLITSANFLACHNFSFLDKFDMLKNVMNGGTFLLTSIYDKDEVWSKLPGMVQKQIIDKKLKFYVIDAINIAEGLGLGARINTIMQTAFFKISKVIDENIAIEEIKSAIKKTYGRKGEDVVKMNISAVDKALSSIQEVKVPPKPTNPVLEIKCTGMEGVDVPEFVKDVTCKIIKREGASLKVSQMPADGTWPTATAQYEKRNIAVNIPLWNPETCIQCGRCSLVCPHAAIRMKMYDAKFLEKAPQGFKSTEPKGKGSSEGMKFTLQVAPEDCTGCGTCVENCPVKAKEAIKMVAQVPIRESEARNYKFFLDLPETDPKLFDKNTLKGSQLVKPLFEYSGACAGCGETAYVKLLTQLFGDRLMIANATGCSSIYGGNLPTTPYTKRLDGRGPAWSNSLFEDAAEFAFGMRLAVDKFSQYALELVDRIINDGSNLEKLKDLLKEIKSADQSTQENIELQRERVARLKKMLPPVKSVLAKELLSVADYLVKKSVWGVGGDGWAYDIGYGGLDHVLASGKNVNILVLDTEVYSNTGGQASKSTPRAAVAQFAASGKPTAKKDLAMMMMSYGYIYVAKVAIGADPNQLVRAFVEAEAYDGPSIIIAYAHCIAHGIDMGCALLNDQKKAVASGHWPLLRFNPALKNEGKNPFVLDSKDPTVPFEEYAYGENRYRVLKSTDPKAAEELMKLAREDAAARFRLYKQLSQLNYGSEQNEVK
ncbi:MAG: pyruvate:ferredoxin (flavodoxin) oxidoreductase [Candidatus Omnitrophica bacterium]|nr:pyruvate:ferredoxin (flavodoxin) oxidoreductase [Candidatus Omnitrophota bacterium]MDD5352883.1 pyruvate:ferredoxin (flavodoxin) oxidoreductase [Candidatus Omnitrophota bacterium]MDD5550482.1 pyruvate:ferredoxin (flavodoxin) oxidoreductase [Candidatus Omnitrophota bacterium]